MKPYSSSEVEEIAFDWADERIESRLENDDKDLTDYKIDKNLESFSQSDEEVEAQLKVRVIDENILLPNHWAEATYKITIDKETNKIISQNRSSYNNSSEKTKEMVKEFLG